MYHDSRELPDYTPHKGDMPVDGEQMVEVRWTNHPEHVTTRHRAGALNWKNVKEYRLLPMPPDARS